MHMHICRQHTHACACVQMHMCIGIHMCTHTYMHMCALINTYTCTQNNNFGENKEIHVKNPISMSPCAVLCQPPGGCQHKCLQGPSRYPLCFRWSWGEWQAGGGGEVGCAQGLPLHTITFWHRTLRAPRIVHLNLAFQVVMKHTVKAGG